jgi:hypothetical protein
VFTIFSKLELLQLAYLLLTAAFGSRSCSLGPFGQSVFWGWLGRGVWIFLNNSAATGVGFGQNQCFIGNDFFEYVIGSFGCEPDSASVFTG